MPPHNLKEILKFFLIRVSSEKYITVGTVWLSLGHRKPSIASYRPKTNMSAHTL